MKKRIIVIALAALMLVAMLLAAGCNGRMNMLMGRWQLKTVGDQYGNNQQDYPLPVALDIYPDHTIKMLDMPFGKWTMDRNTYTFKSDDGSVDVSGSYVLEYVQQQQSDGSNKSVPQLTVYTEGQPVSYVLQKQADLGPLQSYLRAQASASAAAAAASKAPAATPAPTATSAQ